MQAEESTDLSSQPLYYYFLPPACSTPGYDICSMSSEREVTSLQTSLVENCAHPSRVVYYLKANFTLSQTTGFLICIVHLPLHLGYMPGSWQSIKGAKITLF